MKNRVKDWRAAGLEAQWGKLRNGTPVMCVRFPVGHRDRARLGDKWWMVTAHLWERIQKGVPVMQATEEELLLADLFHI